MPRSGQPGRDRRAGAHLLRIVSSSVGKLTPTGSSVGGPAEIIAPRTSHDGGPAPLRSRRSPHREELRDAWPLLSAEDRALSLRLVPRADAEDFFLGLPAHDQAELVLELPAEERRSWMRLLPPDDAADVIQEAPDDEREALLALLDEPTRREVTALLAYAEDDAGGLMNPRYARLRPDMTVDEAISYLRRQARDALETIYYVYVLDERPAPARRGVVPRAVRRRSAASACATSCGTDLVTVREDTDQEAVAGCSPSTTSSPSRSSTPRGG